MLNSAGNLNKLKGTKIIKKLARKQAVLPFFPVCSLRNSIALWAVLYLLTQATISQMLHVTFKEASEVNGPLLATIPTKYLK